MDHEDRNSASSSSSSGGDDRGLDDWTEEDALPTRSLVRPSVVCPSPEEALKHDSEQHGFDLKRTCERLRLDDLGRVRFINWIRRGEGSARPLSEIQALKGTESFFTDQEYLHPTLEDDQMLMIDLDDIDSPASNAEAEAARYTSIIADLQSQLASTRSELLDLRTTASQRFRAAFGLESEGAVAGPSRSKGDDPPSTVDTKVDSYFGSYDTHEIHSTMLRDTVRTESYRSFLSSNPASIKGKRVLDIGCGTGILSFFAARAGAARVYAVDASAIAAKAERHARENGLLDVVKVINRKAEDLTLEGDLEGEKVDLIVSEWMGYACLYESMLPSVLVARDRFLRPGGCMAPSQCSILLTAWGDDQWWKDRIGYWDDVYGFQMRPMVEELWMDAQVESVTDKGIRAKPVGIRDVHTTTLPADPKSCINFNSPFELVVDTATTVHAFLTWFETFFTVDGRLVDPLALEVDGNASAGWKTQDGEVGFSTGPRTKDTHWHQTLFLLREPIKAAAGTRIKGDFCCRISESNSREIEAEIRWTVLDASGSSQGDFQAQVWRVR